MVDKVSAAGTGGAGGVADGGALPAGVLQREDGVYFDAGQQARVFQAAVNFLFQSGVYFAGLDYPVLCKALYNVGPPLPPAPGGAPLIRFADAIAPFQAERRALYKAVKLNDGRAEYFFEPLFLEEVELPDGTIIPERPAVLEFDEFVADMWNKGIRYGLDVAVIKAAIASQRGERATVARRMEAEPPQDAHVVEVSQDLHRSDAPREKADGRIDLLSFQNRFPQIKKGMRLLEKKPGVAGQPGWEMSGLPLPPLPPADLVFGRLAGAGTVIERQADGEFLVALQDGFLSVDTKSGQISVNDKIVSRDGVSGRTTGNLELAGGFEEFGDVQELREVHGSDITIHGNVYGNIHSSGGEIVLGRNMVGGSAVNARGDIRVAGVVSGSTLQTRQGEVHVAGRAENCVITGTTVVIEEAQNCEIFADEVRITLASGCAVAARSIQIDSAGPRKQSEMLLHVLVPDNSRHDQEQAELRDKADTLGLAAQQFAAEVKRISELPDVRRYLHVSAQLRSGELQLKPEQAAPLRKIAEAVAPQLKLLGQLQLDLKAAEAQHRLLLVRADELQRQKQASAGHARCLLKMVDGDTVVRTMPVNADAGPHYDMAAKDCKAILRGPRPGSDIIFSDSDGALDWTYSVARD